MAEEDLMKKALDIFEEEITFDEKKFYSKVKEYLNFNQYLEGHAGNHCMIYLTNHLNPNQMPYSIILSRRGWNDIDNLVGIIHIQKNHPLGEEIKKDLGKLLGN